MMLQLNIDVETVWTPRNIRAVRTPEPVESVAETDAEMAAKTPLFVREWQEVRGALGDLFLSMPQVKAAFIDLFKRMYQVQTAPEWLL